MTFDALFSALLAAPAGAAPPVWAIAPFVILLLAIAIAPLVAASWWHHHYPKVAFGLGAVILGLYLMWGKGGSLAHVGFEYLSFISILSCLFMITGGIVVQLGFKGTPVTNVCLLLFGAVLANAVGTTGASMLLIRPFLIMNKGRLRPYHVVFFIFMVSNVGGALTPIGDPPLMLGYLRGIEFVRFFELNLPEWFTALALLATVFFLIDRRNPAPAAHVEHGGDLTLIGVRNIALLAVAVGCVLLDPNRVSWVPGITHGPAGWGFAFGAPEPGTTTFSFMREFLMLGIGWFALKTSPDENLRANGFTLEPIREVAILFVGIFLTMLPALELIRAQAVSGSLLGFELTPIVFYFGTGIFSGILDNAPTFIAFLAGMEGKYGMTVAQLGASADVEIAKALGACAVASVFWGAMTYIGNGPNFMVKAIVENAKDENGKPLVEVPTFFGYIFRYAVPILLPILILIGVLFYR